MELTIAQCWHETEECVWTSVSNETDALSNNFRMPPDEALRSSISGRCAASILLQEAQRASIKVSIILRAQSPLAEDR
jgi:hypothetical protein